MADLSITAANVQQTAVGNRHTRTYIAGAAIATAGLIVYIDGSDHRHLRDSCQ
jgi:hypothetical protein